jgi:hypothetical protein
MLRLEKSRGERWRIQNSVLHLRSIWRQSHDSATSPHDDRISVQKHRGKISFSYAKVGDENAKHFYHAFKLNQNQSLSGDI